MTKRASFDWKNVNYPRVGELWDSDEKKVVIAGNSVSSEETLWVMDWDTGQRIDATEKSLVIREDRKSLTNEMLVDRFSDWANKGISDAMWFLAYWFEGTNHPKSIWYYIAALRADWDGFGWAFDRIYSDAHNAVMCQGVAKPDLNFLTEIPEFEGTLIKNGWKIAVKNAQKAIHISTGNVKEDPAKRVFRATRNAPAASSH